ncbi:hypothetical protein LGK99_07870 [Clostridium algidicarnis]|uniref:hypothetical protein n=1 Tax=Clostridium algidicarnis TaxID=37659 RepID=UPI001625723C|nr:hypothetical protein [Clostridium algidicarnis]MBB6631384.1 hypothetical protein [Clostridium algidicarnis]MCB2287025.1 hypothetical protein [Clostridium algidicarnis]
MDVRVNDISEEKSLTSKVNVRYCNKEKISVGVGVSVVMEKKITTKTHILTYKIQFTLFFNIIKETGTADSWSRQDVYWIICPFTRKGGIGKLSNSYSTQ